MKSKNRSKRSSKESSAKGKKLITREELSRQFRDAALRVKDTTPRELADLEGVIADGLNETR